MLVFYFGASGKIGNYNFVKTIFLFYTLYILALFVSMFEENYSNLTSKDGGVLLVNLWELSYYIAYFLMNYLRPNDFCTYSKGCYL